MVRVWPDQSKTASTGPAWRYVILKLDVQVFIACATALCFSCCTHWLYVCSAATYSLSLSLSLSPSLIADGLARFIQGWAQD